MVYNNRSKHDCFEINCIYSTKKNPKTKKRKASKDIGITKHTHMECSYSTESLNSNNRPKTCGKMYELQMKPLNRSQQNLCCSAKSVNESPFRCHTPLLKGKKAFYDSGNIDLLNIPESDRRILEILTLKKGQEKQSEQLAYQSQLLWEKSQLERLKAENEQKHRWQRYIKDKRKSESLQNLFRMEDIKQSLRESQKSLEERLTKRDVQVDTLKKKYEEKKIQEMKGKRDQALLKKAIIDANCKYREDEIEEYFQRHIEELEEKLNKAESVRRQSRQKSHRRVASANRCEDLRHQENVLDLLMEQSHVKHQKEVQCKERESRARERQIHNRLERERSLRRLRAEQEEKGAQVRDMHCELQRGLEAWQDQVMLLQWADHRRAEAAVHTQRELRRQKLEEENKERTLLHQERIKRVREAEKLRQQCVRETINAKEQKMVSLQRQRERELMEGRAQAQLTAELREHLRRTLSPETFDRKVARAALETRIGNRPMTASPSILSSHIRLG